MNKLISVLVPVYNQHKYIEKCLRSLLNQSYDNYEIVLLNDGSTDDTYAIIEPYLSSPKIKYFYKDNEKSIAKSRNFLLEHISGEYFVFVDSDDIVSPHFLSNLYKAITRNDSDVACCNYTINYPLLSRRSKKLYHYEVLSRKEALVQMITGSRGQYVLWNKLIKTELVGDLSFPILNYGEDFCFIFDLMQKDLKVALIDNKLYFYRFFVNRLQKEKINDDKLLFLKEMIVREEKQSYLKDKELLSFWIYNTARYYLYFMGPVDEKTSKYLKGIMKDRIASSKSYNNELVGKILKSIFGF